jgi:superfamily II DNA or RNA helicase
LSPLARGDKRSLLAIAATGEVVYRIKTEVLIEQEVLARPTIHMVEMPHRFSGENFQDVYEHEVTNSKKRNELVALLAAKAEKPAFVFVKEKHHGALLVKAIERAGMQVRFIFGNHAVKQRTHAIGELVAGRLDVLVCSVVFQEGIDVPSLRSVVIASGGKSVIAALQRIGRGMRVEKKGGAVVKDTFDVYDVADIGCGCDKAARDLGTPGKGLHNSCRWLTRHTRERERAYISEGHAVHREPHPLL